MPIYEYDCQACGREVEVLVLGQAEPICPECQSKKMTRKLSMVSGHVRKTGSSELPQAPRGGCGRPQCGTSGCQGLG